MAPCIESLIILDRLAYLQEQVGGLLITIHAYSDGIFCQVVEVA